MLCRRSEDIPVSFFKKVTFGLEQTLGCKAANHVLLRLLEVHKYILSATVLWILGLGHQETTSGVLEDM